MSDKFYVGLDVTDFADKGIFRPVSRVTLLVDDNVALTAGDDTGTEISASCPHATQEMVNSLLTQFKGYQYHAYTAGKANIDPAAELGDGVTTGGIYSVLSRIKDDGNGYADLSAPGEAVVEDEYPDAGPMTRQFARKIAQTRSLITKTAEEIRLEVTQEIDGLSSGIDIKLNEITSTVQGLDGRVSTLEQTDSGITATVQGLDGRITTLEQTDSEIKATIKGQDDAISTVTQTVDSIETTIEGQAGEISTIKQTLTGIETTVGGQGSEISTIKQTITGIQTTVQGQGEDISTVTQTANKVNWLIKSGTSASDFTMTDRAISLVADSIDLTGFVTFSSLTESGKTEINGANITTGTISAARINVGELKVTKIYGNDGKQAIFSSGKTLYIGTDGSYGDYDYTNICARYAVQISYSGNSQSSKLVIDTDGHTIYGTGSSWDLGSSSYPFSDLYITSITFDKGPTISNYSLGSSTYYWDFAYIEKLYLSNNCYITAGDSSSIKVGATTIGAEISKLTDGSYSVELDGSTLKPGSNYSLGSSSYRWRYGYIDDAHIDKIYLSTSSTIEETSTGIVTLTASLIPNSSNSKELGSSSYYWKTLYVSSIQLIYNSYTSIKLTCNSSKKLCVNDVAIH